VSIVLPVRNAELWLDDSLSSVLAQRFKGQLELSIYNDSSTDASLKVIDRWRPALEDAGIRVVLGGHYSCGDEPKGGSEHMDYAHEFYSPTAYTCWIW
jgi:hypothetical protein